MFKKKTNRLVCLLLSTLLTATLTSCSQQNDYSDYETYYKEENRIVQHKYSFEKEVF